MKNFFFILLVVLMGITYAQEKTNIAVLELDASGISKSDASVLSDRLRTELFRTQKFIVLERDKMNEILNEQGFQMSGCTSTECVVEAGKLIGVQMMVAGNVARIDDMITLNIRLIDVGSGEVIKTATEDCECQLKDVLTRSLGNVSLDLAGTPARTSSSQIKKYQTRQSEFVNIKNHVDYKSPVTAFSGSFFLPGIALGQYYNGDYVKGAAINVLVIGSVIASTMEIGGSDDHIKITFPLIGITYLYSIIDAPVSANKKNKQLQRQFGHLMEKQLNHYTLGFDFVNSYEGIQGKFIIHF